MNGGQLDALAAALAPLVAEQVAEQLPELLEQVAERMAAAPADPPLIDANEAARRLGVNRSWVYENRDRLGGVQLGDGARARLRFPPEKVSEALGAQPPPATRVEPRRRRQRSSGDVEMLPVKGARS